MTLTVLTDEQIRGLLENLTASELEGFRHNLASALQQYSAGDAAIHQPDRISVTSAATGATTLFMPSASSAGNGIKVITLTSAKTQPPPTTTTTTTTTTTNPPIRPTGAITLFGPDGAPRGLLHASALTAFRTALASLCMVRRRAAGALRTLVVFGCGEQAYWHVRLALRARGREVRRVVFVGRRGGASGAAVVRRFEGMEGGVKEREGWAGCGFGVLAAAGEKEDGEDEGGAVVRLAEVLREADVIFCCTPSLEPLFDARLLAAEGKGPEKGRLLVAIGSYTPEMREIPGELIRQALGTGKREAGVVVVDTAEGALIEAGELIAEGVKHEQLVELQNGVLTVVCRLGALDADGKLASWLETGNVIYKSVGLGLMDLTVGTYLVEYAGNKGFGTQIEGF
ncbi:NAD(P)-binding protein [Trichocladium antarcticum]|uniref:NAD(P)-binding protein n=1 Tax=Trichocladium antarcticum TaxID=1450529 RepID=A0AAN6UIG5_9PEZI|nr:NAD(P)-binding protein [Trichocladium antarcticum]